MLSVKGSAMMKKIAKKSPKKKPCKKSNRTNAARPTNKKNEEVEQPKVLTKEMKANVERIMLLPHEMRWKAGAMKWSFVEQAYAKAIEKKRMNEEKYWGNTILDWY